MTENNQNPMTKTNLMAGLLRSMGRLGIALIKSLVTPMYGPSQSQRLTLARYIHDTTDVLLELAELLMDEESLISSSDD